MIVFDGFAFAAPPRTAAHWFANAATAVGLGAVQDCGIHQPTPRDWAGFSVSLVRHPYDWLYSYYQAFQGELTSIRCIDQFALYAKNSGTFDQFVEYFLRYPNGTLGKMFDSYSASAVMRVEDQPWAAIEFFTSLGIPGDVARGVQRIKPINPVGAAHKPNPELRRRVMKAERELAERYDYF